MRTTTGLGLLLALFLVPFALVAAARRPAPPRPVSPARPSKGCISGTIRTEVDVVEGVDVNVTGPGGFDETATSDERGKWSVTVTELGEYTADGRRGDPARRTSASPATRAASR